MSFCRESTAGEGREAPAPHMHGNSTQFGGMSLSQENFHLNDCFVCWGVDESMRLRRELSCIKQNKKKSYLNTWIYSTVNFNHRMLGGVPFSVFFFHLCTGREAPTQRYPKKEGFGLDQQQHPQPPTTVASLPERRKPFVVCARNCRAAAIEAGDAAGHGKPRLTTALPVCVLGDPGPTPRA